MINAASPSSLLNQSTSVLGKMERRQMRNGVPTLVTASSVIVVVSYSTSSTRPHLLHTRT
uniref:Uncharacterized protein n=1 Tax=Nelumbo nucifera TaxID=4432 RepID=A0A822XS23_NELNU|nr:TPA_asm: hypothetical protein HUJ06_023946 [Nelumbo nucifera]